MGLSYQRVHDIYGSDSGQAVVLQDGILYTRSGKRIPDEVTPEELSRLHIPQDLRHLIELPAAPTTAEAEPILDDADVDALLLDLDEEPGTTTVTTDYRGVKVVEQVKASDTKGKAKKYKIGR